MTLFRRLGRWISARPRAVAAFMALATAASGLYGARVKLARVPSTRPLFVTVLKDFGRKAWPVVKASLEKIAATAQPNAATLELAEDLLLCVASVGDESADVERRDQVELDDAPEVVERVRAFLREGPLRDAAAGRVHRDVDAAERLDRAADGRFGLRVVHHVAVEERPAEFLRDLRALRVK